ncbi:unnamed protein product [Toxocara canis]|uniref:G2/mitotic-specific cyclin-B3 n=1 Tax=Toxocara canis TaxID=6265 RepID=A0A183VB97_TOXCA|nr:unnamed protein product [Toxocara canis]
MGERQCPAVRVLETVLLFRVIPIFKVDGCPNYDYDVENRNDPNAVSIYAVDIFRYHVSREKNFHIGDYLKRQKGLKRSSRAVLVDWLVDMQQNLELTHETLYLSVKLMDVYFDRVPNVTNHHMQLIAASALFIASKFEERWIPLIDDLIYSCEKVFTRNHLVRMEQKMLRAIRFDIGCPLSYSFLRRYGKVCKYDMRLLTLARYILETSLLFYEFVPVSDSLMAAASLLLAVRIAKLGDWNTVLVKYSGYRVEDVEPLMWSLNHMMLLRPRIYVAMTAVYRKYSDP